MGRRYFIIPIFVPHLGCPHDCVFCNQKRITGLSTDITIEDARRIIEEHLATFPKENRTIEVAFFGGSFTGIDRSIQESLLSLAYSYKESGKIDGIRLSTRPDYIDEAILDLLTKYGVDTVELGVQSLDEEVLYKSGRGHNREVVYKAAQLIKSYGINLGLQMMLGLVDDTREKSINTAKELIALDPYCVRIYPTLVIKDTYLEKLYLNKEYRPLTVEEAVDWASDILLMFEREKINVIRIGLQPTENIQLGKDVVGGPFHPSFRQLVEANILKKAIEAKFIEEDIRDMSSLTIRVNNKLVSNVSGQKSSNLKYFKEKYNLARIKVYGGKDDKDIISLELEDRTYRIDTENYKEEYLKKKELI